MQNNNTENPGMVKKTWLEPEIIAIGSADIHGGAGAGAHEKNYTASLGKFVFPATTFTPAHTSYHLHHGGGSANTYVGKNHPLNFYYS